MKLLWTSPTECHNGTNMHNTSSTTWSYFNIRYSRYTQKFILQDNIIYIYISRHPICLTDSEYDYILEKNGRRRKIEFSIDIEIHIYDERNWYEHVKWILYISLIYLYMNYHQICLLFYSVSILCFWVFICMHCINIIQVSMFIFILVM